MSSRPTRLPNGKRDPTYVVWFTMKERCLLPTHNMYPKYGGAGITVCERWLRFENFLADMGERPPGKTLDRYPDGKGNYEPGNCRWATPKEQARNRRSNRFHTFQGATRTLPEWAEIVGIPVRVLKSRVTVLGWPMERALTEPHTRYQRRTAQEAR